jgi:teichuronic acid biosynthesis glycosyltransferase TuaC
VEGQWLGSALFIAPHTLYFIGDQLRSVEKRIHHVSVLIPSPRFSSFALRLPFASGRFASLQRARESGRGIPEQDLLRPRYFSIPGRFAKALTNSLAAESSSRAVSRTGAAFDVIHSHFLGLNGFIGQRLKEEFGKPLVLSAYGGDAYSVPFRDSFSRRLAESMVREADGLIAVSKPIAQNLITLGADQNKICVIPTGFDSSLFVPVPKEGARSRLGLPQHKKIILNVANLVPQKGQIYLLESFSQILGSRSDLILVLVGGGELAGALRSKAAELGLQESVAFVGPRPHEEIPTWISACDLFVLPSLSEGSPTVIPEAMACGRPVVATNVGGIPDVLTEGEQGRMVPPKDVNALAVAIGQALDQAWSDQAIRAHALSYSWDALAAKVIKVYEGVSHG